jgi:hypothetical protein
VDYIWLAFRVIHLVMKILEREKSRKPLSIHVFHMWRLATFGPESGLLYLLKHYRVLFLGDWDVLQCRYSTWSQDANPFLMNRQAMAISVFKSPISAALHQKYLQLEPGAEWWSVCRKQARWELLETSWLRNLDLRRQRGKD